MKRREALEDVIIMIDQRLDVLSDDIAFATQERDSCERRIADLQADVIGWEKRINETRAIYDAWCDAQNALYGLRDKEWLKEPESPGAVAGCTCTECEEIRNA